MNFNSTSDDSMEVDETQDPEDEMEVDLDLIPLDSQATSCAGSSDISRSPSRGPALSYILERESAASTSSVSLLMPHVASSSISASRSGTPNDWYPIVASDETQFQIMYVPDPTRALRRNDAEANLGWTKREISFKHYEAIKHLSGFVYKVSENRKGCRVLISEWVSSPDSPMDYMWDWS
jgi:hypothetical protein